MVIKKYKSKIGIFQKLKDMDKFLFISFIIMFITVVLMSLQTLNHNEFNTDYKVVVKVSKEYDPAPLFKQLSRMDNKTLTNLKIIVDTDKPSERGFFNNKVYNAGEYDYILNVISLHNVDSAEQTLIHEIGHKVWYKDMTAFQRNEYKYYWVNSDNAPSMYAYKNIEENFAENFKCYWLEDKGFIYMFRQNSNVISNYGKCRDMMDSYPRELIANLTKNNGELT